MIAYISLGASRIVSYSPVALSVFLNSPNYIKPPRTSNFIRLLIGGGIIVAEYDEHKRQRRILTPAFGVSHIRQITPHFWMKANQLAEEWRPVVDAQPEGGIDIMKWMNRLTLDIIGLAGSPSTTTFALTKKVLDLISNLSKVRINLLHPHIVVYSNQMERLDLLFSFDTFFHFSNSSLFRQIHLSKNPEVQSETLHYP